MDSGKFYERKGMFTIFYSTFVFQIVTKNQSAIYSDQETVKPSIVMILFIKKWCVVVEFDFKILSSCKI